MVSPKTLLIATSVLYFIFTHSSTATAQTDFDYSTLPGMDPFSRADIVSTRAYGDGDVNSDGKVDFADAQAVYMGTKNDYADVDGSGVVNASDGKMIEELANGDRKYLPSDINAINKLEGVNEQGISRRRAEKIDWLNKMLAIEKTDEERYTNGVFECGSFAGFTAFDLSGVKNLENSNYYNNFSEEYREKITNGRFNTMQVYRVATIAGGTTNPDGTTTSAGGHWINGAFVGDVNPNVKDDPTDFKQWYFWEPQTDKEVVPGDFSMKKDSYANIYCFGESPNFYTGEWKHSDKQILAFDLSNGIAAFDTGFSKDGISNYLVRENPHRTNPKFNDLGEQIVNAHNGEVPKTPGINSDSEHYTPTVKVVKGEKVFTIGPEYPEYFEQVNKYLLNMQMGRWDASNLSNLGDTLEVKTTYADITKPTLIAPADVVAGHNADMGVERMGEPVVNDDSPYPLTTTFSDRVVRDDASYKVIERTWSTSDVSGNVSEEGITTVQKITLDQAVGVNELSANKSFDLDQNYPNPVPVNGLTTITYTSFGGDISFRLIDLQGITHQHFNIKNAPIGEHKFQLDMTGMKSGVYFLIGIDDINSADKIVITKSN